MQHNPYAVAAFNIATGKVTQAIHRGSFRSVRELTGKIRDVIDGWNDRAHPFVWTKTADEILTKANRQKTSDAAH